MRLNYLSIPKLQRLQRWSLGMNKHFFPHLMMYVISYSCWIKVNLWYKRGHRVVSLALGQWHECTIGSNGGHQVRCIVWMDIFNKDLSKGVPQGSILGPLIFNIFMNNIFYFVKNAHLFNYADDNSVSVNGKGLSMLSRLLQSEAEVTVRWFSENTMEANPSKSHGILFKGNKQVPDFNVSVDGKYIEFCRSMTALGICIDENLTFDIHIDNICLKASRQICALQRLAGLLDFPSRKAIYNSFLSHFNYCPLVCFFTSKASIAKMQKIQERALRFVLKDSEFQITKLCWRKMVWIHLELQPSKL